MTDYMCLVLLEIEMIKEKTKNRRVSKTSSCCYQVFVSAY